MKRLFCRLTGSKLGFDSNLFGFSDWLHCLIGLRQKVSVGELHRFVLEEAITKWNPLYDSNGISETVETIGKNRNCYGSLELDLVRIFCVSKQRLRETFEWHHSNLPRIRENLNRRKKDLEKTKLNEPNEDFAKTPDNLLI